MAQLPDNIASFLAVDFSGNVVNVDASLFVTQTGVQQTTAATARIPQLQSGETTTPPSQTTVVNNTIQSSVDPYVILADSFYVPLVNIDKSNFINSSIYQMGAKIGINTRSPLYLLDVNGGSINIKTNTTTTYGFKIDGNNIAYVDKINNTIIMGDATILTKVNINTLLLSGLINSPVTGITRYLTIDDAGLVSAVEDVEAARMKTRGRNSTGTVLTKGTIVYILGSTGNRPNFVRARANAESTSSRTFGVIYADIPDNSDGYAVSVGHLDLLDTRSATTNPFTADTLVDGDTLYLSPSTAGYVTNVKPSAPNHIVYIGKVIRAHPTQGTIVYQFQNGYELDEIHDVAITSKTNKDFIYQDGATSLWKNAQFDSIMTIGGQVSGTYGNMTLVNDAVIAKTLNGSYTTVSGIVGTGDTIQIAFGKLQNQINGLSGSLVYKGTWNASTNTPTLTSSTGTNGNFYIVSVAGTTTLNGISSWAVGDWAIFNGSVWQKIANQSVTQVNGYTGIVTLYTDDVTEKATPINKYYTDARVAAYLTGAISSTLTTNLTASRALASDVSGKIVVSAVTSTELGYVSGVTSSIQTQLNGKEPAITAGTTAQYWRGDKSWQTLDKSSVGLSNVDNTSDANKPISTATSTALSGKEPSITAGTITQYWRGDKSWQTLPTYTLSGLGGEPAITAGTTSQYWRGDKTWQTLPVYTLAGLGGEPIIAAGTTSQYWRGDKTWQTLPSYSLPIASSTVLGGIKVGNNLSINATTGVLDATFTYSLPTATASVLGGVKIGSGVSIDVNGVISVSTSYQAPLNGTGYVYMTGTSVSYKTGTSSQFLKADGSLDGSAYTTNLGTVTLVNALSLGTSGTDLSSSVSLNTTTPTITLNVPNASATARGVITSTDWSNFSAGYSGRIASFTTTGTSGVASFTGNVLNIPNYTLAGLGGEPIITAGTTAQYWRGDKTWQTLPTYTLSSLGGIGGGGTAGRVPKFSATSTLADSLIKEDATGIGINISGAITEKLDVNGNIKIYPATGVYNEGLSFSMPTTATWGGIRWRRERSNQDGNWAFGFTQLDSSDDLVFTANDSGSQVYNILRLTKSGFIGMGVSAPAYKLEIAGDVNLQGGTFRVNGVPISGGGISGSGTVNYVSKWSSSSGLTNSNIIDNGGSISLFGAPTTSYFFNIKNAVSGTNKFISFWAPTDSGGNYQTGILVHNGGGLFDQTSFFINASEFNFSVGISAAMYIDSSRNVHIKGANVSGGGALQVVGDVNITGGTFKVDGVAITAGGGGGAVSSVFGRTGSISSQYGDYNIGQISGISISSPTAGQVLTYNGSVWVNAGASGGGGSTTLAGLSDVAVSGQTNGQVLTYNSATGKWTNQNVSGGGGSGIGGSGTSGKIAKFNGSTSITDSIITEGTGSITVSGVVYATSYYESSDKRLKHIESRDGDVAWFRWKDGRDDLVHIGYIAQEIKEKYPSQVIKGANGYYSVNYTEILVDKVARLENRVKELETKLGI